MRMLHFPEAGIAQQLAREIAKAQEVDINLVDKIPPAYNVEKERLVFIGIEKGSLKVVSAFCKQLSPERVKNVAFYSLGAGAADADELKKIVEGKGIAVANTLTLDIKGGLFKKAALSADDIKKAVDWAAGIVDSLADN
jgi:hypothetical protein